MTMSKTTLPFALIGGLRGVDILLSRLILSEGLTSLFSGEVQAEFGLVATQFLKLTDQLPYFSYSQTPSYLLLNLRNPIRIRTVQLRMIWEKFFFKHRLA